MSLDFTIIGENIHTTRVLMRNGKRIVKDKKGEEFVSYKDLDGNTHLMPIPDQIKDTKVFTEGRVKHFMVAVILGMSNDPGEREIGEHYIKTEVLRQENAGATFLDLNVDEISHKIDIQKASMKWLIGFYCSVASIPPSIDSSSVEIIRSGLNEYQLNKQPQGVPMINSASLERLSVLDDVSQHSTFVMITAAGFDSMPEDDEERLSNVSKMIDECWQRQIPLNKIHVDPLLFPISVDKRYGNHFLDSIKGIRKKFGEEIHISGGMSNVSFGLPARKLINDTLIKLSIDAGANSGIINPLESDIEKIQNLDLDCGPVKIASEMLLGHDEYCMNFISQFREGNLKSYK